MKSKVVKEMINNIPYHIKEISKQHAENTIMHNELIRLGFEYNSVWKRYRLFINDKCLYVIINKEVIIEQDEDQIILFNYNHDKVKQLIELLK